MEPRVFTHGGAERDMVSVNMFKLHEKYSEEPQSQREGNTVRSFKGLPSEWPPRFHLVLLCSKCSHIVFSRHGSVSLFMNRRDLGILSKY